MTTNITTLVQNPTRYGTNSQGAFTNQTDGAYVSYLDFMALVEELEKAQQRIASQRKYYEGVIADGGKRIVELDRKNCELDSLTQRWAVERAENADRIAALESRTVKLPKRHSMLLREGFNEDYHTEMAYKADEVQASLAAAGIKVEAE